MILIFHLSGLHLSYRCAPLYIARFFSSFCSDYDKMAKQNFTIMAIPLTNLLHFALFPTILEPEVPRRSDFRQAALFPGDRSCPGTGRRPFDHTLYGKPIWLRKRCLV